MSRGRAACTAVLLAGTLASCAPRPVALPRIDSGRIAERYRAALVTRQSLAAAVDAEASAWLRGESLGRLPGVHARLALGAPRAFRVRVESALGVALDFAAWGESLACFLPARRMGVVLDAAAESLGVRAPGPLGARVLAATWEPPAAAWARAGFEDSLAVVGWKEEGDSLTLRVGSDGLPSTVELSHARGDRVEARYRGWDFVEGVRWPAWMEFEDRAAGLTLTLKLGHLVRNVAPARDRLVVRVPPDAERLEWPEVRRALERTRGL